MDKAGCTDGVGSCLEDGDEICQKCDVKKQCKILSKKFGYGSDIEEDSEDTTNNGDNNVQVIVDDD